MTLKQHAQSLYELGMQFKEMNAYVSGVYFEIKDANPLEMDGIAKENKRELSPATINGKDYLRVMAQPFGNVDIIIWVYSHPVKIKRSPDWELIDESGVPGIDLPKDYIEIKNVSILQPPQTTPLTSFTSNMDEENKEQEEEVLRMKILTGKD